MTPAQWLARRRLCRQMAASCDLAGRPIEAQRWRHLGIRLAKITERPMPVFGGQR